MYPFREHVERTRFCIGQEWIGEVMQEVEGACDGQPKYFHSAKTVSILSRKMYTDLHSDT